MTTGYAELAVTTNFSFLRGASHPGQFVTQAAQLGYAAIGIADRNTLAGVVRAYAEWKMLEGAPRLLIGARLVFRDGTPDILAYPKNRKAYGRLCQLISLGKHRAPKKGECFLDFADLQKYRDGLLLIVMPDCICPPLPGLAEILAALGPETWLAASMLYTGEDSRRLKALKQVARSTRIPLIAVNDALYHHSRQRDLQDVVTCIREHVSLKDAGTRLQANAERHLKPPEEMARLFRNCPEAVAETVRFCERITFTLAELGQRYPREPVPKGKTADGHLRDLTEAGLKKRYPQGVPPDVAALAEKELCFIAGGRIAHYFLTVHDIVAFARGQGILCQGRGSAANSVVCYALGVTAVDPTEIDVLFERFLNTERREPPDIDVDFEHERREEVIQHIYKHYGHRRAALTATVIRYRPRSAIREVGKVFGLTEDVTGKLADTVWGHYGDALDDDQVRQGEQDPANVVVKRAVQFANRLLGFPRHLSQHVGGFVLTRDYLDSTVPIGPAAMDDRYFIEWDKDDLDTLAIMKVDVLALGMLTCIRKAFRLIDANSYGPTQLPLNLAAIPQGDPVVYDMLCNADAIGVFQVESRAQMNMLPRLRPRKFYDLVVEVAIVRPGPIQGGMVHPYLKRRKEQRDNPGKVFDCPKPGPTHPQNELIPVLEKTLGVPLFQEQAMKLAIVAAKFSGDEANGLRRAMATFRHVGTIGNFERKFIDGMTSRGYEQKFAESCFEQIKGFGSYGFPESHAASFALLVYVSAWIKCHHPAAFAAALLNSQPMGFYAPAEIVRCAREHGVPVLAADAAFSDWDCTLERDAKGVLCLRLGFRQVDGFRQEDGHTIMAERGYGYPSFAAFARRTVLSKRALVALAEADAFRSFGLDRREGLWAVLRLPDDDPLPLFAPRATPELGAEHIAPLPLMALSEHVLADYQTTRLSLKGYPTQFLRAGFAEEGITSCKGVSDLSDGASVRCAGVVLVRQRPGEGNAVFITLSDETGVCNVVVWARIFDSFRKEVMGARLLLAEGKVQKSPEGVIHLMAENLIDRSADLRLLSGAAMPRHKPVHRHPRDVRILPPSRDFH
jgi:error-prone DNA polymerase